MSGGITAVAVAVGASEAVGAAIAATAIEIGTDVAIGAALGTVTSAITGGDIGKGALFGAIGGAVTGGIGEAMGSIGSEAGAMTDVAGATTDTADATTNLAADGLSADASQVVAGAPSTTGDISGVAASAPDVTGAPASTPITGSPDLGTQPYAPAPGAVTSTPLPAPDGAPIASSNGLLQPASDTGITTPIFTGVNGEALNMNGPAPNFATGNDSLVTNVSDSSGTNLPGMDANGTIPARPADLNTGAGTGTGPDASWINGNAPAPEQAAAPEPGASADAFLPQFNPGGSPVAAPTLPTTPGSDGIFGKNGWIAQNEGAVKLGGDVAKGLGTGLLQQNQQANLLSAYQRLGQNQIDLAAANRAALTANYAPSGASNTGGLLSYNQTFNPVAPLAPTPTFTPSAAGGQWVYSPSAGKVVYQVNKTS